MREYEKVRIVGLVDDHSRFLIGLRALVILVLLPAALGAQGASAG